MREFVVQTLLLGFCHIVISENKQVAANRDHNITLLLQPFVQERLVTLIPYNADGGELSKVHPGVWGSSRLGNGC